MAQVDITVNGRSYTVACDDGQEAHLHELAADLDKRVRELAGAIGQIGDARLLVMTGLVMADEVSESLAEIKTLRAEVDSLSQAASAKGQQAAPAAAVAEDDDRDLEVLESLAVRLETVAEKLADA